MKRQMWAITVVSVIALVMLAGSVVAQSQAPSSMAVSTVSPAGPVITKSVGKLSFRLAALAHSPQLRASNVDDQARALSLPANGPGSLLKDSQGRLLVDIRTRDLSASNLQSLRDAGAMITHVSDRYNVVTALVDAADLDRLAGLQTVENVQEELTPMHASDVTPPRAAGPAAPSACPGGAVVSEGDTQLNASTARSTYSLDGTGVKVGILSDSYNKDSSVTTAAQDVASGDLPGVGNPCGRLTAVSVISEYTGVGADEGRAMLQIVHDLAPGATLGFATASAGLYQFADNIRNLRTWGANIIADDVSYFAEPFYQEGPVSVAISDVVGSGVAYFTSAANSNRIIGGNNVTSYEAPAYRPASSPISGEESCHDFNPTATTDTDYSLTVNNGGTIRMILQWAQPWYGVTTDLDLFVVNSTNTIVAQSYYANVSTQTPFETVQWLNVSGSTQTYRVYVCRYTGSGGGNTSTPRFKWVMARSTNLASVEYPTSSGGDVVGPTIYGHSASRYSLSVAAAPYNDNNNPETFSSRGPATLYFGPVVNTSPAPAITPLAIQQPDFTATDGGCTTFFSSFSSGCYRFYGTSAAAPHAAAVATLLKQKANQMGPLGFNQSTAKSLLQQTARSMSGGNTNSVGAGLIDALGATQKLAGLTRKVYLPVVLR